MFDIGAIELLMIVVVAVIVIGPKDMPLAMRTAGRWIGKMRKLSGHFRSGIDAMVRDAEMEEMEKKWRAQNEKIMREHPHATPDEMQPTGAYPPKPKLAPVAGSAETASEKSGEKSGKPAGVAPPPAKAEDRAAAPPPPATPDGAGKG